MVRSALILLLLIHVFVESPAQSYHDVMLIIGKDSSIIRYYYTPCKWGYDLGCKVNCPLQFQSFEMELPIQSNSVTGIFPDSIHCKSLNLKNIHSAKIRYLLESTKLDESGKYVQAHNARVYTNSDTLYVSHNDMQWKKRWYTNEPPVYDLCYLRSAKSVFRYFGLDSVNQIIFNRDIYISGKINKLLIYRNCDTAQSRDIPCYEIRNAMFHVKVEPNNGKPPSRRYLCNAFGHSYSDKREKKDILFEERYFYKHKLQSEVYKIDWRDMSKSTVTYYYYSKDKLLLRIQTYYLNSMPDGFKVKKSITHLMRK